MECTGRYDTKGAKTHVVGTAVEVISRSGVWEVCRCPSNGAEAVRVGQRQMEQQAKADGCKGVQRAGLRCFLLLHRGATC